MAGFARKALLVLFFIALAVAIYQLASVILLVAGAVVIAAIVHLFADPITRRLPVGQRSAVFIVLAVLTVAVAAGAYMFGAELARQSSALLESLPQSFASFRERIEANPVGAALVQNLGDVGDGGALMQHAVSAFGGAFILVSGLVVMVATGVMFAVYPAKYRDGMLLLAPPARRERLREAANACGKGLKGWMLGQLVSMTLIATLISLGLLAIGMPSWFILGIVAGIAQFVPVLGPIASAIPGLLIALSDSPELFWQAAAVYFIVQQLEGNLITPFVLRKTASLPMALTLLSIISFGALFGLGGAILATPIAVVIYILVQKLYLEDTLGERLESA